MEEDHSMITASQAVVGAKEARETLFERQLEAVEEVIFKAIDEGSYSTSFHANPRTMERLAEVLKDNGYTVFRMFEPPMNRNYWLMIKWYPDSHLPEYQQSEIDLPANCYKVWTNRKIHKLGKYKQESKSILSKVYAWLKCK